MSALKTGCDMAYVFTSASAAAVIKGYSPELMVLPDLPEQPTLPMLGNLTAAVLGPTGQPTEQQLRVCVGGEDDTALMQRAVDGAHARLRPWLSRCTVVVVGPGLGDDPWVNATAARLIATAREMGLPLLVDGSGINIIVQNPGLVRGYSRCVLTPNLAELGRLAASVGKPLPGRIGVDWQQHVVQIAKDFGGPVVVSKGPTDIISNGSSTLVCSSESAPRRSGGQGDVLAGSISTFVGWAASHPDFSPQLGTLHQPLHNTSHPDTSAAAGLGTPTPTTPPGSQPQESHSEPGRTAGRDAGCTLTRSAAMAAYEQQGRALLAGDILQHIPQSFRETFGK
ncbi:MAG: hypothetical protein WDW36_001579 [Sanguina aurantia]